MADRFSCFDAGPRGFTLIECLVVLSVLTVMLSIGLPSFQSQIAERRAKAGAYQLYAAMQFARSAAQRHQADVVLCPIADPAVSRPNCGGHFGGFIAAILQLPTSQRLLRVWSPTANVTVRNRSGSSPVTGTISWNRVGLGSRNMTLSVCSSGRNWAAVVNRLGRPRLAPNWGEC